MSHPSYTRRVYPPTARVSTGSFNPYDDYYSSSTRSPRHSGERVGASSATTLASEYRTDRHGNIIAGGGHDPRHSVGSLSDVPRRRTSLSNQQVRMPDPRAQVPVINEARSSLEQVHPVYPVDRYERGSYGTIPAGTSTRGTRQSSSIDDSHRAARRHLQRGDLEPEMGISRAATFDTAPRGDPRSLHLNASDRYSSRHNAYYDSEAPLSAHSDLGPRRRERRASSDDYGSDGRSSMVSDPSSRSGARDNLPPVTTRGLDKINGLTRSADRPSSRERGYRSHDDDDDYYVAPRRIRPPGEVPDRLAPHVASPTRQGFDEGRASTHGGARYKDEAATRGFGIRGPSAEPPPDRNGTMTKYQPIPAGTIPDDRSEIPNENDYLPPVRREKPPVYDDYEDDNRERAGERRRERGPTRDQRAEADDPDYAAILERERHDVQDHLPRGAPRRHERDSRDRVEQSPDKRPSTRHALAAAAIPATAAGAVALAANEYRRHQKRKEEDDEHGRDNKDSRRRNRDSDEDKPRHRDRDDDRDNRRRQRDYEEDDRRKQRDDDGEKSRYRNKDDYEEDGSPSRRAPRSSKENVRERDEKDVSSPRVKEGDRSAKQGSPQQDEDDALVREAESNYKPPALEQAPADVDDEYHRILQQELERSKQTKSGASQPEPVPVRVEANRPREAREEEQNEPYEPYRNSVSSPQDNKTNESSPRSSVASSALARYKPKDEDRASDESLTEENGALVPARNSRVRIVEPPKEKDKPKGILRQPTRKFPDYPEGPKEAIAPLKPVEGAPEGSKWVKINRSLVSPRALEEAGERFEETKDHVTVLRVLSQAEIMKYADRSKELRGETKDKDKRRDDRDRDRRKDDEHDGSEYDEDGSDENGHRRHRHGSRRHKSRGHDDHDDREDDK